VGDIVLEESVEAPSHAIVVERGELPLGEAEQVGDVARRPLADAVEGLAGEQQVLEQDQESDGRIDAASSVAWRADRRGRTPRVVSVPGCD
jgi:hypothetical protein